MTLAGLARWCFRRRRLVLGIWLALLIGLNVVGAAVGSAYSNNFNSGHSDAEKAFTLLRSQFPARAGDPADIAGAVSAGFLRSRGTATFRLRSGRWLDVRRLETLEALRAALGATLHEFGLTDVDLGGVCGHQRAFTQSVAAWAYEHGYHGIVYASRFGASFECWAIFDNARIEPARSATPLSLDDPDLVAVASVFALHLPGSLD